MDLLSHLLRVQILHLAHELAVEVGDFVLRDPADVHLELGQQAASVTVFWLVLEPAQVVV